MESAAPPEPSGTPLASEHEEIAVRLMAAGPGGVDQALLAAAAKALRDVSVLDKQLLRAREVSASLWKPLGCVCIVSRYHKPLLGVALRPAFLPVLCSLALTSCSTQQNTTSFGNRLHPVGQPTAALFGF